jgi:hypothetical protein
MLRYQIIIPILYYHSFYYNCFPLHGFYWEEIKQYEIRHVDFKLNKKVHLAAKKSARMQTAVFGSHQARSLKAHTNIEKRKHRLWVRAFKDAWAHSFGQFKKHALLKARTQSPCFSYPGLARAFITAGSADLLSFGGDSIGWPPDLLCWLPVNERAKMRPVYSLIVGLTGFLSIFCIK